MLVFKRTGWGCNRDEVVFSQTKTFDCGCIRTCYVWGSIQEWGCIQANTATCDKKVSTCTKENTILKSPQIKKRHKDCIMQ